MDNQLKNIQRLYSVAYNTIATINGRLSYERVTDCIIKLANLVAETETPEFFLQETGEFKEFALDSLLIGAYWHYEQWHNGQSSRGYRALSAIGRIYSPGMESEPEQGTGERIAFEQLHKLAGGIIVSFRKFPDGDIIALWDNDGDAMMHTYMHNGEHCPGHYTLLDELETASPEEYESLYDELDLRGYPLLVEAETETE